MVLKFKWSFLRLKFLLSQKTWNLHTNTGDSTHIKLSQNSSSDKPLC